MRIICRVGAAHRGGPANDAHMITARALTAGGAAGRLLPILGWLPFYQRAWLLPDVLAGLAVWAVMVPEGMAYAGIVGVPPIMGLYTIVPPLIAYAFLGTSRLLVVGPDTVRWIDLCFDRRGHGCAGNHAL
jgi:hypothetical protein